MRIYDLKARMRIYVGLVVILIGILSIRLIVVQLVKNETYQIQAKENSVRLIPIKATRGEIFTHDKVVIASNKLVYTINLTYFDISKNPDLIKSLVDAVSNYYPDVTVEYVTEKIKSQKLRPYEPITLIRDIPWELVVKLEENRQQFPGVMISTEPLRSYPFGTLAGHVLGYIHQINAKEIEEMESNNIKYSLSSLIGKAGIEKQYEQILKGQDGARRMEVDAKGRLVSELDTSQPSAGNHIYLTIDSKLQQVMESTMEQTLTNLQKTYPKAKVGSAVLMDVKKGSVLAMCSQPSLNPDDWKGEISIDKVAYYFPQTPQYDPMQPGAQTNRAISSAYPPGSTFKPVTGMAALRAAVMNPLQDYVNCGGAYWIKPNIRCTGVHGNVNYLSGMAHSCNTYFQEMGRRAGQDNIVEVGREFGLGSKTGIDLPNEINGQLPSPEWKKDINAIILERQNVKNHKDVEEKYDTLISQAQSEAEIDELNKKKKAELNKLDAQYKIDYNFNTNWQQFDTFNMSIGQGYNNFTVMQLANYVSTIANGGYRMKPYLVDRIEDSQGRIIEQHEPEVSFNISDPAAIIPWTKRAMTAVTEPGGTAYSLFASFPDSIKVGAKTGTAESGRAGDSALKDVHGVFIAFAPADNPEIAFAGLVEYGYSGYGSSGIVCKALFEQYFGIIDHLNQNITSPEPVMPQVENTDENPILPDVPLEIETGSDDAVNEEGLVPNVIDTDIVGGQGEP